jgi:hypothetical protein
MSRELGRPAHSFLCEHVSNRGGRIKAVPRLNDMKSWTDRLGHSKLRTLADENGHFWLEQNATKSTKWAKLAREGPEVAWEFESPGRTYTGRMLIDGEIYPPSEGRRSLSKARTRFQRPFTEEKHKAKSS